MSAASASAVVEQPTHVSLSSGGCPSTLLARVLLIYPGVSVFFFAFHKKVNTCVNETQELDSEPVSLRRATIFLIPHRHQTHLIVKEI